jgi:hypothetical protein
VDVVPGSNELRLIHTHQSVRPTPSEWPPPSGTGELVADFYVLGGEAVTVSFDGAVAN